MTARMTPHENARRNNESPAIILQSILTVLRSRNLSDQAARAEAERIASDGVLLLEKGRPKQLVGIEPVALAFRELEEELATLVKHRVLTFDLVSPPERGRALPVPVAEAARDVVRLLVLISVEDGDVSRVRIKWDCDGMNLLMEFRDDGAGNRDRSDDAYRSVAEQVEKNSGIWSMDSTEGWGSRLHFSLPLDGPTRSFDQISDLTDNQRQVLGLVAQGNTNAEIAAQLHISSNTVKYHVSNLLEKFGVARRAELAALTATGARQGH